MFRIYPWVIHSQIFSLTYWTLQVLIHTAMEIFSRLLVKLGLETHYGLVLVVHAVLSMGNLISTFKKGGEATISFCFMLFVKENQFTLILLEKHVPFFIGVHVDCWDFPSSFDMIKWSTIQWAVKGEQPLGYKGLKFRALSVCVNC